MLKTNTTLFQPLCKVVSFTLPICVGFCINMVASFVSMMMVANLGPQQLAAGALAVSTNITVITVVATFFYSVGISIGHSRGQQQPPAAIGKIVRNGLWMALGLTIPSSIALWNVDHLLTLFKQDPALIKIATTFFHYASFAILPILINAIFNQFFTGTGRPRFTMITSLISMPLTISLAYVLILGHFGFPAMGLAGISCAALIVQTTLAVCISLYLIASPHYKKYALLSRPVLPDTVILKQLIVLGFPIGVQFGAELAALTVSTYFMGYFGVMALAASQVASQYSMLIIMIILGLSQAISILSSEAYGSKDFALIRQYIRAGTSLLVIAFLGISIIFIGFPEFLIKAFLNGNDELSPDMFRLCMQFLTISAITLFADGLRHLFAGALRGMHDAKTPMNIGVISMWFISLPLCYLIGITLNGGPIGLRIGFASGFFAAVAILYFNVKNKLNNIVSSDPVDVNADPEKAYTSA